MLNEDRSTGALMPPSNATQSRDTGLVREERARHLTLSVEARV